MALKSFLRVVERLELVRLKALMSENISNTLNKCTWSTEKFLQASEVEKWGKIRATSTVKLRNFYLDITSILSNFSTSEAHKKFSMGRITSRVVAFESLVLQTIQIMLFQLCKTAKKVLQLLESENFRDL